MPSGEVLNVAWTSRLQAGEDLGVSHDEDLLC